MITRSEMLEAAEDFPTVGPLAGRVEVGAGDLAKPYPFPRPSVEPYHLDHPCQDYRHPEGAPVEAFQMLSEIAGSPVPARPSLLDIGAANGVLARSRWERIGAQITALDIWPHPHPIDVEADALEYLQALPPNTFDVIQCTEMLEHVPKSYGIKLLAEIDRVAGLFAFITTPCGFAFQPEAVDGNPHQVHVCGWDPEEFLAFGYGVLINGPEAIREVDTATGLNKRPQLIAAKVTA